jgi:DNA-directed RNA polymerase specialized sigma24 family protein
VLEAMRDDAWDVVVALEQESGQRLYGYALRLGIDSGRAADLVQEALLRLWHELGHGTVIASR